VIGVDRDELNALEVAPDHAVTALLPPPPTPTTADAGVASSVRSRSAMPFSSRLVFISRVGGDWDDDRRRARASLDDRVRWVAQMIKRGHETTSRVFTPAGGAVRALAVGAGGLSAEVAPSSPAQQPEHVGVARTAKSRRSCRAAPAAPRRAPASLVCCCTTSAKPAEQRAATGDHDAAGEHAERAWRALLPRRSTKPSSRARGPMISARYRCGTPTGSS